jgi:tRNA uridine 5-carbamoylmethylation protein Kti12
LFLAFKNKTLKTINKQNIPYLVVIRGPLGVGKSTIATLLAQKLDAYYVSIDKVLEDNDLDKRLETEECISVLNFIKANEIELPNILKSLAQGQSVVVDGNFYHKEALEHLINSSKEYNVHVFTLKSPLEICIDRDSKRANPHGHWPAVAVHKLVSRFDYGICIDTSTQTVDKTLELVTEHLQFAKDSSIETLILIKHGNKSSYFHPLLIENGFDFPFWIDMNKLWALNVPVETISIDELEWMLDVPQWKDERGYRVLTPREVLESLDKYPEHKQRIDECDTSYAIDIMKNKKDKWLIHDGYHRLIKLYSEGQKLIKVRKIPEEIIYLAAKN